MPNTSEITLDHISNPTKQKIVRSAIKIISQNGYSASTTKKIANEAGVSEATIFRYFETKKDILLSLLSPSMIESISNLFFYQRGKSIEEFLNNFFENRFEAIYQNRDLLKIIIYEALFHPEIKQIIFEEIIVKKIKLFEDYFDEKKEQGELKDIEPKICAVSLIGMLISFTLFKCVFKAENCNDSNNEEIFKNFAEIILHGIKK